MFPDLESFLTVQKDLCFGLRKLHGSGFSLYHPSLDLTMN